MELAARRGNTACVKSDNGSIRESGCRLGRLQCERCTPVFLTGIKRTAVPEYLQQMKEFDEVYDLTVLDQQLYGF